VPPLGQRVDLLLPQKEELYWQQLYARVAMQMLEALCGHWQTPTQATADGFLLQSSYLLLYLWFKIQH
jgi:hypothetical protein